MKGFQEIHSKKFLHRDLKPSNILIHNGIFKISDFGVSSQCSTSSISCGTKNFMAPEVL